MDVVDEYIPTPVRDNDKPFLMPVEDVFTITGRGTVASGRIDRGTIKVGEEVEIVGLKEEVLKSTVTGLEMFRKTLPFGEAGDNVGVLLRGINRDKLFVAKYLQSQVRSKPTVSSRVKFISFLKKKVAVIRHSSQTTVHNSTSTPLISLVIRLPDGVEMVMPGDNVTFEVD